MPAQPYLHTLLMILDELKNQDDFRAQIVAEASIQMFAQARATMIEPPLQAGNHLFHYGETPHHRISGRQEGVCGFRHDANSFAHCRRYARYSICATSSSRGPLGLWKWMVSPSRARMRARASGETQLILPSEALASSMPTICQRSSRSVSTS